MKSATADYFANARRSLDGARAIADAGVTEAAARETYLAAYHAAEGYIFEHIGKAAKTHRGVSVQLNRLAQSEPRIDRALLAFLAAGYQYKTIADYEVGPVSEMISIAEARAAIDTAARFVDILAGLLP